MFASVKPGVKVYARTHFNRMNSLFPGKHWIRVVIILVTKNTLWLWFIKLCDLNIINQRD